MYGFALTPRWIIGHALALVLVTTFVFAGFWQWSRHVERTSLNSEIEARASLERVTVDELANTEPADLEFRSVEVTGGWVGDHIIIRGQPLDGLPGCHVVSVLSIDDQPFDLVVNRGWAHLSQCEDAGPTLGPPNGDVALTGRIRTSVERGRFQPRDPADGVLSEMARIDVRRIAQQVDEPLAPVFVDAVTLSPDDPATTRLGPPTRGNGPHLGYAVQWFLFAVVGIVGYPLVLRRQARAVEIGTAEPGPADSSG